MVTLRLVAEKSSNRKVERGLEQDVIALFLYVDTQAAVSVDFTIASSTA